MMNLTRGIAVFLLMTASPWVMAAPESCERVKSDIEQRIINNGVAESSFTLNIVPNDQADQPDSQVVGHCANDTHKILYTRTSSGNAPANSSASQDGHAVEPQ
ncbi:DUF1161 domain-containing protein [Citrobacter sp. S2-9]|uniref:DUF1161 domain-containing protein n=2 Tax=Citrobacter enshiensis TaxID=2971264 RepID=A0ABT8PSJ4_9ENTR|nr:DUF1161 domain-containing protein [Citrobacter enshiensis]MDN8598474.1 DUF1161 domain-containing protein [Citrobacter enshiensis]WET38808.1 DUF1161 domain-containing protein [Citrobacter enshiensis]